jgi:hypothetical protein
MACVTVPGRYMSALHAVKMMGQNVPPTVLPADKTTKPTPCLQLWDP